MESNTCMNRRQLLKRTGIAGAGLLLSRWLQAGPAAGYSSGKAVRIRGAVRLQGKGLGGVAVTDGQQVTTTAADGTFSLISPGGRPFVYLSLPAGVEIPCSAPGVAALHQPVRPDAAGEASALFNLQLAAANEDRHAFLVLADPQLYDPDDVRRFQTETAASVQTTLRILGSQPVFGVVAGDLMFDRHELYPDYVQGIGSAGVSCFQVLGNHDVNRAAATDELAPEVFGRYFGPSYYSFNRGRIHYVVLDSVFWQGDDYFGYLDQTQLEWLRQDLELVEKGGTVVLFMHIPPLTTSHLRRGQAKPDRKVCLANRRRLNEILEPFQAHVFAGHMHEAEHLTDGRLSIHVCGAVCGGWWEGPVCPDGTPAGYQVVEVEGSSIRWRYQGTGLPPGEQIRVYPRGADPAAPEEMVANVWDWSPGWQVYWYEQGIRRGSMSRRTGMDPLARQLYNGDQRPARHRWVEAELTGHLFYAPVPADCRDILVEAIDPFGRGYKQAMKG